MAIEGFRVEGRVQGVGFRWWTRTKAEGLGLRGTVRNERDGSVVVVAAGDEAALRSFRELLETGPPPARVDAVTSIDAHSQRLPDAGFEISG